MTREISKDCGEIYTARASGLIEQGDEICVDGALVHRVEIRTRFVEVGRELHTDEAPVPRLEDIVTIRLGVGENEAVAVGVRDHPRVGGPTIKSVKLASRTCRDEVHGGSELMLGIALICRELVRRACTIGDRVLPLECSLGTKRTVRRLDVESDAVCLGLVEHFL